LEDVAEEMTGETLAHCEIVRTLPQYTRQQVSPSVEEAGRLFQSRFVAE
jgi:hypothetical protein